MKNKLILIITLIFALIFCGSSAAADWTVGPGGTYDYTNIQSAVNGAGNGDTITVYDNGGNAYIYQENVVINKNNLIITTTGQVTVSGSSSPDNPVFAVNTASSHTTISGFNINGATNSAGVYIEGTSGVNLNNLNISQCKYGVQASGSQIVLDDVSISNVSSIGVYLNRDIVDLTIQNSHFSNSGSPVYKDRGWSLDGFTFKDSEIVNAQGDGVYLYDYIGAPSTLKNILIDNITINGATGSGINIMATVPGSENLTVTDNHVSNCSQHGIAINVGFVPVVTGNVMENNGSSSDETYYHYFGLSLSNSNTSKFTPDLSGNTVSGNYNGIYLKNVTGLSFPGLLTLSNNRGYLFYMDNCSYINFYNGSFSSTDFYSFLYGENIDNLLIDGISIDQAKKAAIQVYGQNINLSNLNINQCYTGAAIFGSIITLDNVTISNAPNAGIYLLGDVADLTIQNCHVSNSGSGVSKDRSKNINGLIIKDSDFLSIKGHAIYLNDYFDAQNTLKNISIDNVTIDGAAGCGINIREIISGSTGLEITNNRISNCTQTGISLGISYVPVLSGNIVSNNGSSSDETYYHYFGISFENVGTVKITPDLSGNTVSGNYNGIYLKNVTGLSFPGLLTLSNNRGYLFYMDNCSYINFYNGSFSSTDFYSFLYGEYVDNLLIDGISIDQAKKAAIQVYGQNITFKNLIISQCNSGIQISGSHFVLDNVSISNTSSYGVYFFGDVNDFTVQNNCIFNHTAYGIYKPRVYNSDGITIRDSQIINAQGDGLYLYDYPGSPSTLKNVLINNVTITAATGSGINIMATVPGSENINITNNTITNSSNYGIYLNALVGVTLDSNTIRGNNIGLYLKGINGTNFQNNQLFSNTSGDLYAESDTNNTFTRLTVGLAHPTVVTFDYNNGIKVNGIESAPQDPTNIVNMGLYLGIDSLGSTLCNLKIYYTDLGSILPSTLKMWKYNGGWSEISSSVLDTTDKYVYAHGINSFGTFAPLGIGDIDPPVVSVDKGSGSYKNSIEVNLSANDVYDANPQIYYQLNNAEWLHQVGPVLLTFNTEGTQILKFYGLDQYGNESPIQTMNYVIDYIAPTASASLSGGYYNVSKPVSLTMSEAGNIYYTLDGSNPSNVSSLYSGPIMISSTKTLKFIAVDLAGNISAVYSNLYTIDKTAPKVSSTTPANNKTGFSRSTKLTVNFNEKIKTSTYFSKITVKNLLTGKKITISSNKISGNLLYITTTKRTSNTWYLVTIPAGAVRDLAGNNLAKIYTFKFKTGIK